MTSPTMRTWYEEGKWRWQVSLTETGAADTMEEALDIAMRKHLEARDRDATV